MQPSDDVLERLRAATREQHARLDAGLAVAAPHAGLAEYRAHLHLLWQWLAPMHAWLAPHEDGPQDPRLLPPCPRLQWLHDDLIELDGATPAAAGVVPRWPRSAPPALRWGACYVVEGSQLGARVLLQRLAPRLEEHRPRLLAGGGALAQGHRWQQFRHALRREVRTPAEIQSSCAGAVLAFEIMLQLSGLEAPRDARAIGA